MKMYGTNQNLSATEAERVFGKGFETRVAENLVNEYADNVYYIENSTGMPRQAFVQYKRDIMERAGDIPMYGKPMQGDDNVGKYLTYYELAYEFGDDVTDYADEELLNEYAHLLETNFMRNGSVVPQQAIDARASEIKAAVAAGRAEAELQRAAETAANVAAKHKNLVIMGLGALVLLALIRK